MARVVLENVSKTFCDPKKEPIQAVSNVSFTAEDKELLVIVGPSGSGKSTVLRLIAGLESVSSGTVAIDSVVVNRVEAKDRDIAMVFQNFALYPHMTVYENLAFPLKLRKTPKAEAAHRVREAAEMLGLVPYFDRFPKSLSGGERQRVAVGRAIVRRPKVFLFDEPLSNLDAQMRVQMRTEIAALHKQLGATMIYVTHDQIEAMTLGDRVAVLRQGGVQQIDKPLNLYNHPASLFVGRFIGSPPMNLLRGRVVQNGGHWRFLLMDENCHAIELTLPNQLIDRVKNVPAGEILLGLRPEHVGLAGPRASTAAHEPTNINIMLARIELIEPLGAETYLHVVAGSHRLIARITADARFEIGQDVKLAPDLSKTHFFDPATEKALLALAPKLPAG